MAYLNVSDYLPTGAGVGTMPVAAAASSLSAREWLVVRLAQRDGLASLSGPARFGRLRAWLFGTLPDPRLADPRLEALRRVAVHAWRHGFAVPVVEEKAFLSAGYRPAQLEALVTWVDARR